MKQKLAIARALLHDPSVVFLDEPTAALDPEAAFIVREAIETLRRAGRTIVLATHNLDEADRLCDRIAFVRGGLAAGRLAGRAARRARRPRARRSGSAPARRTEQIAAAARRSPASIAADARRWRAPRRSRRSGVGRAGRRSRPRRERAPTSSRSVPSGRRSSGSTSRSWASGPATDGIEDVG